MELALQVVGLKMTGKIEDARNVAMRIVGSSDGGSSSSGNNTSTGGSSSMGGIQQTALRLASPHPTTSLPELESLLINFLNLLDLPSPSSSRISSIPTERALRHTNAAHQSMLHLAAFLGLERLCASLVERGADVDARDGSGFTALHFAALKGGDEGRRCAEVLLGMGGADVEVVDGRGRTAREVAAAAGDGEWFVELLRQHRHLPQDEDSENEEDGEEEESRWGDAEGESEEEEESNLRHAVAGLRRRRAEKRNASLRSELSELGNHSSPSSDDSAVTVKGSGAVTPLTPLRPPSSAKEKQPQLDQSKGKEADNDKEKEAASASFVDSIQRTLSQWQWQQLAPQAGSIVPPLLQNIPMNIPNINDIAGNIPLMPWALQQIPVAFPIFVPGQGWTLYRGAAGRQEGEEGAEEGAVVGGEWKNVWDKWIALAVASAGAGAGSRTQEEEAPPVYTPRADDDEAVVDVDTKEKPKSVAHPPQSQQLDYSEQTVPEQEVKAYAYHQTSHGHRHHGQKVEKKQDHMLILFWIPILMSESFVLMFFMRDVADAVS